MNVPYRFLHHMSAAAVASSYSVGEGGGKVWLRTCVDLFRNSSTLYRWQVCEDAVAIS